MKRFHGFVDPSTDPVHVVPQRTVWTRQPSGKLRLNQHHPILRNLLQGVAVQGGGGLVDLARSPEYAVTTDTTTTEYASGVGWTRRLNGASGYIAMPTKATADPWSYIALAWVPAGSFGAIAIVANTPGGYTRDRSMSGFSNDLEVKIVAGTAITVDDVTAARSGMVLCAATAEPYSLKSFIRYRSGGFASNENLALANVGRTTYTTPTLVLGYGTGSGQSGGSSVRLAYFLRLERVVEFSELDALAKNPWQIFE